MEIGRINQLANNVRSLKEELEQISPGITAERQFTRADLDKSVADEREACAMVCDKISKTSYDYTADECAQAIRNRGKKC